MERLKERVAHIGQYAVTLLKWMVLGGVIGLVGGIIGSLFHIGVDTATQVRLAHSWVLYLMPVGGLAIVGLYRLTKTEGKGTNDVIASVHFGEQVPGLLVPVIFVSTVITHLCGGSAGREGAALQIGGGIGYQAGRLLRLGEKDLPLATLCGMSGVFAALFGTPLTATVFALEVISVGVLYYAGLVPCLTAALTGYLVSVLMGVPPTRFTVTVPGLEVRTMLLVMVLALLCAVVSILFCRGLHGADAEKPLPAGGGGSGGAHRLDAAYQWRLQRRRHGGHRSGHRRTGGSVGMGVEAALHRHHHRVRLQGRRGGTLLLRGSRLRLRGGGLAGPSGGLRGRYGAGVGVLRGGELPAGLHHPQCGAVRLRRSAVFRHGLLHQLSDLRLLWAVQQPDHPLLQAAGGVHQRPNPRVKVHKNTPAGAY